MPDVILVWRIGVDTPTHTAEDIDGKGAEATGGRWNPAGVPILYTASSRALACLETLVHLAGPAALPLNRYLVEVTIDASAWAARTAFKPGRHVGWDARPPGRVSLEWGRQWVSRARTLVAEVPSVIVPEETCVLLNPRHPDMAERVTMRKIRRWQYDPRLQARTAQGLISLTDP